MIRMIREKKPAVAYARATSIRVSGVLSAAVVAFYCRTVELAVRQR